MSHSSAVTALQIADESFLVASTIERCPKTMMIRELIMNALEAASLAPLGRRLVEISAVEIDGGTKLAIWNTGPGMDGG
jgi:sensor histidine kinase regulating citrate/malate metabolism